MIRNEFTRSSLSATQSGASVVQPQVVSVQSTKRSQKGRIKSSTVAIYASIFILLVSVIAVGYRAPQQASTTAPVVANAAEPSGQPAVNKVLATDIAASVAHAADMAVAPNVTELAVSTRIQSEYQSASSDSSTISKPTFVEVSAASRNITTHEAQPGDTAQSVAALYGLSPDTIKWANDLRGDTIAAGSSLQILPRDGIAYTVRDGDTIEKLAEKYKADAASITIYNDLEINGLTVGLKIIIPNGVPPTEERPGYVAPRAATYGNGTLITGYSAGFGGGKTWHIGRGIGSSGGYAYGNCTSYAHWRRAQMGRPLPSLNLGNAGTWASRASAYLPVNKSPAAGAVIQDWGHVAIVEAVLPNGDLEISEMNASVAGGGYNVISGRILPASQVGQYMYIH